MSETNELSLEQQASEQMARADPRFDGAMAAMLRWAQVDPNDEDEVANLQDAMLFAEGYLAGAGVPLTFHPVRDVLLRKMTLYFYENRSADSKGVYPAPPPDLNALVLQLRSG